MSQADMGDPIQILLFEESSNGDGLLEGNLEQQGILAEYRRVNQRESFMRELGENPDLILLNCDLPPFTGLDALKITREQGYDTPCIFISTTDDDDLFAEVMAQGADDFILRDQLSRLGTSILRVLNERKLRDQKTQLEVTVRRLERSEKQIGMGHWEFNLQTGRGWWSKGMYRMLGFDEPVDEFQNAPDFPEYLARIHPDDREMIQAELQNMAEGRRAKQQEYRTNPEFCKERILWPSYEIKYDVDGKPVQFTGILLDITERKLAEQQYQEGVSKIRIMLDTMSEGIALNECIYDENGEMVDYRILDVNPAFYKVANFTDTHVIGNVATKLYGMSVDVIKAFWKEHKERDSFQHTEFLSPLNQKTFFISTSPFVDNKFVTSFFDITERRQAEDALQQQNKNLDALQVATHALLQEIHIDKVLETILLQAAQLAGTEDGYLYQLGADGTHIEVTHGVGSKYPSYIGSILAPGEGLAGKVWQSGEPLVVDSYLDWDGHSPKFDDHRVYAIVGVPLFSGFRIIGVLGLGHFTPEKKFSEGQIEILKRFAELASIALERARLYDLAQKELAERIQAEESLRESEQTTRLIIDSALDAVITMDADGNITNWNEQAEKTFGWKYSEAIGKPFVDMIIPDNQHDAHRDGMSRFLETGHSPILNRRIEVVGKRRDGSQFPLELTVHNLIVNGKDIFTSFLRDITDSKQAEESLRASKQRLQGFFSQSLDGCFFSMLDEPIEWNDSADKEAALDYVMTNQRVTEVNNAMLEQYGMTREKFIGRTPGEFFKHDIKQAREVCRNLFDNNNLRIYTEERKEDGTPIWIEGDYVCMRDEQGRITGTFGVQRDITDRKRYEETLLQFKSMMDQSNDAILMVDPETGGYIDFNQRAYTMLGYEKDELFKLSIMDVSNEIPDLAAWRMRVQIARDNKSITLDTVYKRKGGSLFPVEVSAKPLEYKGRAIVLDIVRDITERKEAERVILQREADLAKAQAMAHMGSYSKDIKTGQVEWSAELRSIWGLPDGDEPSFEFSVSRIHPDDLDVVKRAAAKARETGCQLDIEYRIIRTDGAIRYLNDRAEVQLDADGNAVIMFGSVVDITERVQAEAERRYLFEVIERSLNEVYIFDAENLNFIYANQGALNNLQYELEDLKRITPVHIKPEFTEDDFRSLVQPLIDGEQDVLVFETTHLRADGSVYPVDAHLQLVEFENARVFLAVIYDITERKAAEASIKEAEAKYQDLVERLPLVVYTSELGIAGRWTYVSPQIENLLGYTSAEWMADSNLWYQCMNSEDRDMEQKLEEDSYSKGISFDNEYRITRKDGREIWVRDSGRVFESFNGGQPVVQGIMIDITQRKKAEDEIKRYARNSEVLYDVSQQIRSRVDLDQVYMEFHHAIEKMMPCEAIIIALLDEHLQEIEDVYLWDKDQRFQGDRYASGQHLTGYIIDTGKVFRVNQWTEEHNELTGTDRFGYKDKGVSSVLAVPLFRSDGRCFGVVSPQSYELNAFTEEHEQLLVTLSNQLSKAIENAQLFVEIQKSNDELSEAYDATIEGWSRAMDLRDEETEGHTQRVTQLTLRVARAMGFSNDELVHIRRGGLLHDIGKLGVPDRILFKEGKLTKKEWEIMRQHPTFAHEMLSHVPYLRLALEIPYCHHEKWDGTGYPQGLKGVEIPLAARIFAVADVWDAITSDRPYRKAWSKKKALKYIEEESGSHFDPKVVKKFLALMSHK